MIELPLQITADDVGAVASIDSAVEKLVKLGIINRLSIFVNGSTDLGWVAKYADRVSVGLHLTFSFGRPISSLKSKSLVDESGMFLMPEKPAFVSGQTIRDSIEKFMTRFETADCEEVRMECSSQITEFRRIFKFDPDFINVHHDLDRCFLLKSVLQDNFPNLPTRAMKASSSTEYFYILRFLSERDSMSESRKIILDLFDEALHRIEDNPKSDVELVFHPGYASEELRCFSSYCDMREREYEILSTVNLSELLHQLAQM